MTIGGTEPAGYAECVAEHELLHALYEAAPSGVVILDRDLRLRAFNPFMERLTGLSASAVLGRVATEAFPHLRDLGLEELWRRALAGETVHSQDMPYLVPTTGRSGWVSETWTPIRDGSGEVQAAVGVLSDITLRKQAELRLEESEERHRTLLENLGVGVFHATIGGSFVQANQAVADLAGYDTAAEFLAVCPTSMYAHSADQERVYAALARDGHVEADVESLRKDGTTYWARLNLTCLRDGHGNPERVLGVATDVTERRRMEEELRVSEERLRAILEQAPVSMAIVGLDGTIEYINHRANETFGYGPDDIPDMDHWWRLAYPDPAYREEVMATWGGLVQAAVEEGCEIEGREYRCACKDGTVKTMYILGVLVAQKVFVMFEDVTERRQAQELLKEQQRQLLELNASLERKVEERTEQLRVAKDAAESATRAKSLFLANMSHEIRTPMHAIMGFLDLVLDSALDHEQREFLTVARSRSKDLLVLIDDILDLSRIEAGRLTLEEHPFSPVAAVDDVVQLFSRAAASKGLRLAREISAQVPHEVVGDSRRVRQVLLNLVGNAIKFTPAGEVVVCLDREAGGVLHFRVRDTGVGVAAQDAHVIFEPFAQAAPTPHENGGTGLGLAIARRLADSMRGSLWLESEPGRGSTFHFTARLPASRVRSAEEDALDEPSGEMRPYQILVVEDDETCRYLVECLLTRRGHVVTPARDGREALEFLAQQPFDLVLMDVQMPGMDGLDTTRAIRSGASPVANPSIPILALTAFAMSGDEKRCLDAGMDGYLSKPVAWKTLSSALHAVMAR